MVSNELGACEWFVWDLRRSGLIDRGQLDQIVGEFLKRNPRAEPPALAEYLISQGILSPFQAERILSGKTQGLLLGPYVLIDTIGQGSMGQVYKASSKTDSNWYAVKVLPRRSMWNVRLARRQVRAFSQFSHPSVVPFIDVGTAGGQHYLVWPLVDGETLENRILREGRLTPETTAQIISQVAQGLAVAHQNGVFHGLIKPSNILLGNDGQARILDFGIGSLLAENEGESLVDTMSTANTLTSGLDCASPESIMEPTNRTTAGDQYSLGCVMYYCLAGRYPFPDGTAVEKMMAHQFKQPVPVREVAPHVPEAMAEIVERLMQKSPDGRYASAEEIVEALQPFVAERRSSSMVRPQLGNKSSFGAPSVPLPPPPAARPSAAGTAPLPKPPAAQLPPAPVLPTPAPAAPAPARPSSVPAPRTAMPAPSPLPPTPIAGAYAVPAVAPSVAPVAPAPTVAPTAVPPTRTRVDRTSFNPPSQLPPPPAAYRVATADPMTATPPPTASGTTPPQGIVSPTQPGQATFDDPPRTSLTVPILIFLAATGVTLLVYFLGKNFLFPAP